MADRAPRELLTPIDGEGYAESWLARLPTGAVWPRAPQSFLGRMARGFNAVIARIAARAAYFLNAEALPHFSSELLPDWERVVGLPGDCDPADYAAFSIAQRRAAVLEKLSQRPGRQDRAFMLEEARKIGYGEITITEFVPFIAGGISCGGHELRDGQLIVSCGGLGTSTIRWVWIVRGVTAELTWFRAGGGGAQAGVDPHLRIGTPGFLECLLHDIKPAHTRLIFDYT